MTAANPKPKLVPITGQPVTVALHFTQGKEVQSRIPGAPNQMYYTLMDGRSMYLPLEVGPIIDALKLRAGELFTILKRGSRDWDISRVERKPPAQTKEPWFDQDYHGPVNGAGEDAAQILARCYCSAIDIAKMAVEAARDKGLMVSPSFEDLRCISTALMISETGRR